MLEGIKPLPKRYKSKREKAKEPGFVENEMNKENDDYKEPSNIMYSVRTVKGCEAEEGVILVGAED